MIPTNLTPLRIEFYKIAKKMNINMLISSEERIEIVEKSIEKRALFRKRIEEISSRTRVVDLVATRQDIDIKGNKIGNSKALYLVDDEYYKRLIGETEESLEPKQLTLF